MCDWHLKSKHMAVASFVDISHIYLHASDEFACDTLPSSTNSVYLHRNKCVRSILYGLKFHKSEFWIVSVDGSLSISCMYVYDEPFIRWWHDTCISMTLINIMRNIRAHFSFVVGSIFHTASTASFFAVDEEKYIILIFSWDFRIRRRFFHSCNVCIWLTMAQQIPRKQSISKTRVHHSMLYDWADLIHEQFAASIC